MELCPDEYSMDTSSSSSDYQEPTSSRLSQSAPSNGTNGVRLKRVHFHPQLSSTLPQIHVPSTSSTVMSMSPMSPLYSPHESSSSMNGLVHTPLTLSDGQSTMDSVMITAIPTPITKDWQQSSTTLRNHFVQKLLCTTFDNFAHNPAALHDPRMSKVIDYFKNMEKELFEKANSRSEYYHSVAERIYNALKSVDIEKRKKEQIQQQEMSNLLDILVQDTKDMTISFEH